MLFATEYTDVWANSTYRAVFTGHIHTEKKKILMVLCCVLGHPRNLTHMKRKWFYNGKETLAVVRIQ